jgi:hypothetical protein
MMTGLHLTCGSSGEILRWMSLSDPLRHFLQVFSANFCRVFASSILSQAATMVAFSNAGTALTPEYPLLVVGSQSAAADGSYQSLLSVLARNESDLRAEMADRIIDGGEFPWPVCVSFRRPAYPMVQSRNPSFLDFSPSHRFGSAHRNRQRFSHAPRRAVLLHDCVGDAGDSWRGRGHRARGRARGVC